LENNITFSYHQWTHYEVICSVQTVRWRIVHQHLRCRTAASGGHAIIFWHSDINNTKKFYMVGFRRHLDFDMNMLDAKLRCDGYLGLQETFSRTWTLSYKLSNISQIKFQFSHKTINKTNHIPKQLITWVFHISNYILIIK